jgi:hypothetical protein
MSKQNNGLRIALTTLKIIWIPLLFIIAFLLGLYIGYGFVSETSASAIFTRDAWKIFIDQLKSLQ